MIRRFVRRIGKSERGATLVEFAIVIPVLLLFLFGIIEFGWIFNGYITLEAAAKEGARLAVIDADREEIALAVKRHAFTFDIDQEELENNGIDYGNKRGEKTTVTVNGELPLLVGIFPFINNPFSMEAEAIMIQE